MSIKQKFFQEINSKIDFWKQGDGSIEEKLRGLAFSILVIIDGESSIGPFALKPIDENGNEGENIAGELHHEFENITDEAKKKLKEIDVKNF